MKSTTGSKSGTPRTRPDGARGTPRASRPREADFRTLAESSPDVIARLDRDLRYLYVNRAAEAAFRCTAEHLVGRRHGEAGLPASINAPSEEAIRDAIASGSEQRFEASMASGAGRRHFSGRVIPESAGGRVDAILLILHDDTARVSAESAMLARDQFLAIVSHELRSPLNGIKSWTHVLENHLRDAEGPVRRALAGIMIGVDAQVRLIEDLLDVARAMSGNLELAKQPMAVLPVLADAVESLRATAAEKGLHLVTDYAIGEAEIHADPDRIRQIFVTLVSNAVKFTPSGGTVAVIARTEGAAATIEVRDSGAGIAPEFLPLLFDPFRQADQASRRRGQQGLGLGLALAQQLAELHGGSVSCESAGLGRGAAFRVSFPLSTDLPGRVLEGRIDDEPHRAAALPSLAGIRVLLIDDQREARESLAALLSQAGASVSAAGSGKEAMSLLEASDAAALPEVILCDIAMPEEDGYKTLRRIRRWEGERADRSHRPIVALSAFTQREDRIRALSEGFQMHITKPVAPAELITVISSVARGLRV